MAVQRIPETLDTCRFPAGPAPQTLDQQLNNNCPSNVHITLHIDDQFYFPTRDCLLVILSFVIKFDNIRFSSIIFSSGDFIIIIHWGETGLANAGVSLSKMDAPKVGKSVFCSFEVFYHNFRASHSLTVFI